MLKNINIILDVNDDNGFHIEICSDRYGSRKKNNRITGLELTITDPE